MRTLLILVMLAGSGCAMGRGWTATDTTMAAVYAAENVVDWYQTNRITARCDEHNPVIGSCGQNVPTAVYFPVTMAAAIAIFYVVPPKYRREVEGLFIGVEGAVIYGNEIMHRRRQDGK